MISVWWLVALAALCGAEAVVCWWYTVELRKVHKQELKAARAEGKQTAITDMVASGMILGVLGPYRYAWHQSEDAQVTKNAKSILDEYKADEVRGLI